MDLHPEGGLGVVGGATEAAPVADDSSGLVAVNAQPRALPSPVVWLMAFASGALSLLAAVATLRLTPGAMRLPFGEHDAVALYGFTKTMIRFGWFSWNPDLGYPYGMDHGLMPAPEIRMWLLLKAVTMGTSDPILALNIFFLLGFFLVGAAGYLLYFATIRHTWLALLLSVSAATIPWHFDRFRHVLLADYSAIPIGLLLAYLMWHRWWSASASRLALGLGAAVYIGTGGLYYAFYSMLAITPVLLWRVSTDRRVRLWWRDALICLTIPTALALALVAHASFARTPTLGPTFTRDPLESLVYAGQLFTLVTPWPLALGPGGTEGEALYNVVGSLATLTTLGALAWLLIHSRSVVRRRGDFAREVTPWVRLFVWMLLWFVPGFGLLFAYLVSPNLRSWGRVSVSLLFIAMVILGICLRTWTDRGARRPVTAVSVLALLVVLQVGVDHRTFQLPGARSLDAAARSFARELERSLPPDCPVLQIPLMTYPEGFPMPTPSMGVYDHMWPQIYADGLLWSFGVESGTAGAQRVASRYAKEMAASTVVRHAVEDGYCAIEIDTNGMTEAGLDEFDRVLGPPEVAVGRWRAYLLDR